MGQKITPNLWFDGNAKEAVNFYTEAFPDSKITSTMYYPKTAEEGLADFQKDMAGKELVIQFELGGMAFAAINADSTFKFNPAISFMLNFDPARDEQAREHLDELWSKLAEGGEVMMELGEYPHSQRYGWVKDRYGVTWQLMLTNPKGEPRPFIIPSLMFAQKVMGRAEEAMKYYLSVFEDAKAGDNVARYPEDMNGAKKGSLMFADFAIGDQWFAVMDAGTAQDFTFNEAVSLEVDCKDQAEIDELWSKLSKVPEAEQCGWCKDEFGVSWQIVPENWGELLKRPGSFAKMMKMKKPVIAEF
jgi:predicted 3-demethylubiquinone-9 3-methyltransferase (glyoxalase superfamily)